jgi:6-phosphogluconolactonase (cycloisomerase 2 family)
MRKTALLASVGGIAAASVLVLAGPANAAAPQAVHVFALNDAISGNAVYAYDRSSDGTLHSTGHYATGGKGGQLDGSVVDHTASQGALAYDSVHHIVYAVNPGTNTVAVFAEHDGQLTRTQVINSGGDFPVSVAFTGNRVFVLNARNGGTAQGYLRVGDLLVKVGAWHRSLGLDPTATPEFTSTPGKVAVNPDGTKLLVTTKGNTNAVLVYDLTGSGLSAVPTTTTLAGAVPFAVTFDNAGRVVLSEAGPSAVGVFRISTNDTLQPVGAVAKTGQAATCWITTDGRRFFASNAGSGSITTITEHGGVPVAGVNTATDPGTVDAAVTGDGANLYVQTGGTGTIDEYSVSGSGSLVRLGSIVVPNAVGGEGIAAG